MMLRIIGSLVACAAIAFPALGFWDDPLEYHMEEPALCETCSPFYWQYGEGAPRVSMRQMPDMVYLDETKYPYWLIGEVGPNEYYLDDTAYEWVDGQKPSDFYLDDYEGWTDDPAKFYLDDYRVVIVQVYLGHINGDTILQGYLMRQQMGLH